MPRQGRPSKDTGAAETSALGLVRQPASAPAAGEGGAVAAAGSDPAAGSGGTRKVELITRERGLSDELRRRIFHAAMDVFAERGFDRAKVEEVAERAGLARATIYYHFRSKRDLFSFLLQQGIDEMASDVEAAVELAPSARAALDAMIDAHIDFYARYQSFARVVLTETWRMDPTSDLSAQRLLAHDLKVVGEVIRMARTEGVLREELNEAFLSSTFYGLLSAAAVHASLIEGHIDASRLKRDVKNLLFHGALRPEGAKASARPDRARGATPPTRRPASRRDEEGL